LLRREAFAFLCAPRACFSYGPDPIIAMSSDPDDVKDEGGLSMLKTLVWFLAAIPLTVPGSATAQATTDAPPFTADEIAIYRDFLLHYPGPFSEITGLEDTTATFTASRGFGDDPNPLNLQIPASSGRKLPPEIMAMAQEKAVTARITAVDRLPDGSVKWRFILSEIAFDSKHEQAVFIFDALCGCKGGQGGTVLYELKDGRWKRKRFLNDWIG
jgi:hypothetical protein